MQVRRIYKLGAAVFGILLIFLLCQSCQEELPTPGIPESAREWVEASARYHDPKARWQAFEGSFAVTPTTPRGESYTNNLYLDRARDTFSRSIESGGFPLVQVVGPSGCSATWPNPAATETQLLRNGLREDPCAYILPRFDYYEFLMGIPMVALEGGLSASGSGVISFRQNPNLVAAFGVDCVEVELTFSTGNLTWFLYIHPTSYRLQAAKFVSTNGSGEWLSYEADTEFNGFLLKRTQRWFRLDGVTEIIADEVRWGE